MIREFRLTNRRYIRLWGCIRAGIWRRCAEKGQSVNNQRPTGRAAQRLELDSDISIQLPASRNPMARYAMRLMPGQPTSRELLARSQHLQSRLMQQIQRTMLLLNDATTIGDDTEPPGH